MSPKYILTKRSSLNPDEEYTFLTEETTENTHKNLLRHRN